MRSRNPLQANDLLDIVDFIKNEEKYSARIKELQDLEASLNTKLKIVNTLEGADTLVVKYKATQAALDSDRLIAQKELKELKEKLTKEHQERIAEYDKKVSEVRTFHNSVAQQMNEVRERNIALNLERQQLDIRAQELNVKAKDLAALELKWKTKVAALQQLLVS